MELKEFICETLTQIIDGVVSARERDKSEAIIAPPNFTLSGNDIGRYASLGDKTFKLHNIDFEVLLTEVDTKDKKKGIGVAFGSINAGIENKKGGSSASNTKINFSIPVIYPILEDGGKSQ